MNPTPLPTRLDGPLTTQSLDALEARKGQVIGTSSWWTITQPLIDAFAEITNDHYFIHTDPERARQVLPDGTIAHGFLTLSLLSGMAYEACPGIAGVKNGLNYGFNKLRFLAPVPAGSRVRAEFRVVDVKREPGRAQIAYDVTVQIEGRDKPALAAEWLHVVMF